MDPDTNSFVKAKSVKVKVSSHYNLNNVKPLTNAGFNIIFTILSLSCVIPLIFVIIISLSSEKSLMEYGYRFWPKEFTINSYIYILSERGQILTSYGISILVTVLGTLSGLILNSTYGYVLSRRDYKFRKFLTYVILIPMLFGGGMVSYYIVVARILHMKDTIWALVLPIAVSSFNIIILRTFFMTTVPDSVIESAKIDGANQLKIFTQIVLPISLPALATIGLFLCFGYWNDWFTALLFIQDKNLVPIQYLLMKIEGNLTLLQSKQNIAGSSVSSIINKLPTESIRMSIVVLVSLPIACAYPFFQRYFVSGLTIGSVKG